MDLLQLSSPTRGVFVVVMRAFQSTPTASDDNIDYCCICVIGGNAVDFGNLQQIGRYPIPVDGNGVRLDHLIASGGPLSRLYHNVINSIEHCNSLGNAVDTGG